MRLLFYPKAGLVATVVAAASCSYAFQKREELHEESRKSRKLDPSQSMSALQGRRQAEQINELLAGLKHKTRREKLEAAYDAATYTHEIGFPPPRPPPLTSSKGGTGKGADSGEGHR